MKIRLDVEISDAQYEAWKKREEDFISLRKVTKGVFDSMAPVSASKREMEARLKEEIRRAVWGHFYDILNGDQ